MVLSYYISNCTIINFTDNLRNIIIFVIIIQIPIQQFIRKNNMISNILNAYTLIKNVIFEIKIIYI